MNFIDIERKDALDLAHAMMTLAMMIDQYNTISIIHTLELD